MEEAVIVTGVRTPIGKAHTGTLKDTRPDDLAAAVIKEALARTPGLDPAEVEDVVLGCALPEGEQGLNVARIAAIRAGLPTSVPGVTVNRFCSSGLQAIAIASERVMLGAANVIVAGGVESMSAVPIMGFRPAPNPVLVQEYPQLYMGMGYTAEEVAVRWGVSREDQDAFALRSHRLALEAMAAGRFDDEIEAIEASADHRRRSTNLIEHDEGPRLDTSHEKLAQLQPIFKEGGTVTAGNSSPMNDGAAALLLASKKGLNDHSLTPLARIVSSAAAGVHPDIMGIGPVPASEKAFARAGLTADDMDVIEINEAFASQSIASLRLLGLDPEKVNVNGGAIAIGHPLGASGARILATLVHELRRRGGRYGLATMCIGVGQGISMVVERV